MTVEIKTLVCLVILSLAVLDGFQLDKQDVLSLVEEMGMVGILQQKMMMQWQSGFRSMEETEGVFETAAKVAEIQQGHGVFKFPPHFERDPHKIAENFNNWIHNNSISGVIDRRDVPFGRNRLLQLEPADDASYPFVVKTADYEAMGLDDHIMFLYIIPVNATFNTVVNRQLYDCLFQTKDHFMPQIGRMRGHLWKHITIALHLIREMLDPTSAYTPYINTFPEDFLSAVLLGYDELTILDDSIIGDEALSTVLEIHIIYTHIYMRLLHDPLCADRIGIRRYEFTLLRFKWAMAVSLKYVVFMYMVEGRRA